MDWIIKCSLNIEQVNVSKGNPPQCLWPTGVHYELNDADDMNQQTWETPP